VSGVPTNRILIVGASAGMGEALARHYAAEGSTLALVARRGDVLEKLAGELGGRAHPYAHDVTQYDEVPALYARIVRDLGGIDLVVYSAGVIDFSAPDEYDFERDRRIIEVNVLGCMAWCDAAAADFYERRAGAMMILSSVAGERGRFKGHPAYPASKAAVALYADMLRHRLHGRGVRVLTVKPGYIATGMLEGEEGAFWAVTPERAARQMAADLQRTWLATTYVPWRWLPVGIAMRHLPGGLIRTLRL